jgi:alpha-beta hydrolase superfamily lysophospholipase
MTTEPEQFTYSSRDGAAITAHRWAPDGPLRGLVQLAHGMGEHVLR